MILKLYLYSLHNDTFLGKLSPLCIFFLYSRDSLEISCYYKYISRAIPVWSRSRLVAVTDGLRGEEGSGFPLVVRVS